MSRGAERIIRIPFLGREVRLRAVWPVSAFTLLDMIITLILLGILAGSLAWRYYTPDFSGQARQQAARAALAGGYSRLKLATASYAVDNGDLPAALQDLSPDYMNATVPMGDYTVVYIQGANQVTLEIYPGMATSGAPLATRTFDWP
ncbi:MAG: hypothetical protein AB9900_04420 [Humidesulfovibrio sp.]